MYNIDFQRKVINLFCKNVSFAMSHGSIIKRDYFDDQNLRIIFDIAKKFVFSYSSELGQEDMTTKLDSHAMSHGFSSDQLKNILDECKSIYRVNISSEQYIVDELLKFCRKQEMKRALFKSYELLKNDPDNDKAYEQVVSMFDEAVSIGMGGDVGYDYDDLLDLPTRYNVKYNKDTLVTTGFPTFDESIMGGMGPGELHIFMAAPKAGKTTLGAVIGANALASGKTVYHATLEIKKDDLLLKYAAAITGMGIGELLKCDQQTYLSRIEQFKKYDPNLFVNYWTEGTASTLEIRSWISKKRAETNKSPSVILLDYDDPVLGDTMIPLLNGTEVPIKDLVGVDQFWLYACKEDGEIIPGLGYNARIARCVDEIVKITLDNGKVIESTRNHNHMLRDGTYKRADEFKVDDSLMPFNGGFNNLCEENELQPSRKVVKVEIVKLDEPVSVYCLTVDKYHNYALSAGIFTHNCLVPTGKASESMYETSSMIYTDMLALADYFKCPVVSMSQSKWESWDLPDKGELIRHFHLSHSSRKSHKAFTVSSLNFASDSKYGVLFLDITRRGTSKVKIPVYRDLGKCLIVENKAGDI